MFFSRRTPSRIVSAFFALLLAIFLVPIAAVAPASAAEADTIHELVNQARWDNGQQGLIRNTDMDAVAVAWAKKMAASGTMSHNPNYSSEISSGWRSAGENVAQGYGTAQAMYDGWMSSQGHRENILGAFTDIGIAFYSSGGTTWGVQVFATYPGHTGPVAPAAVSVPETEQAPASEPSAASTPDSSTNATQGAASSSEAKSPQGGAQDSESTLPSEMTRAELQASVYGNKPDQLWIAWVVFGGIMLLGGAFWFIVWRRRIRR